MNKIKERCPGYYIRELLIAVSATATLLTTPASSAQMILEEVIVTATKRTQSIQDVPVAVTAFNTEQLENNVILKLRDLQELTPSLFIYESQGSNITPIVDIRGQFQNDASVTTLDPSVGIYFNGIYIARSTGSMLEMFDIASVEVLKGSQGTLYGRNTTGGAIKLETVKPEPGEPLTGFLGGSLGNFDSYRYEGAASIPLGDTVGLRISGQHSESDGWGRALLLDPLTGDTIGRYDTNGRDSDIGRLSLVWDASKKLRFTLNGDYYSNNSAGGLLKDYGGDRWTAPVNLESTKKFTSAATNFVPEADAENWMVDLGIDYSFEHFDFKAFLAHRDWDFFNRFDSDGSNFDAVDTSLILDGDQDSVELQFSGLAFEQKLNWLVGLYYIEEEASDTTDILVAGNPILYTGESSTESAAAYAHLEYSISSNFRIFGGLRYTDETKDLDGANRLFGQCIYSPQTPGVSPDGCFASFSDDFDFVSWTLGLDWAFAESFLTYAKVSQGQRSGGQNIRGTGPAFSELQQAIVDTTAPFDEEEVLDYEVGIKSELMAGRARLNAAYYYTDYTDFQYSEVIAVSTYVFNLGDAEVQGVELEGNYLITEGLVISGFLSWLDFEYDEPFLASPSPEWKWGLDFGYTLPVDYGEWSFNLNYSYTDERYEILEFDNETNIWFPMDDYSLVNGRVQVQFNNGLRVAVYGRNLTDEEYEVNDLVGFLGTLGLQDPSVSRTFTMGVPRTYGIEVRYTF